MELPRVRCILVVANGPSRRVGSNGVLIGRQEDCDIVAEDPKLSRRHALVRLTPEGAELIPLGRQPVEVNGKAQDKPHALRDGDQIMMPGLSLAVQIAAQRPDPDARATFRLQRSQGDSFGIAHSPFMIGGDPSDDLIIKKWPAHALALHVAQDQLFVEVSAGTATRNGDEISPGVLEPFAVGDTLVYRNEEFVITQTSRQSIATTEIGPVDDLPEHVLVEILPRGGRVVFTVAGGDRVVYLTDRRLDLLVALLRPSGEYKPGDWIPDDLVSSIVWPRNSGAARVEINVLIARVRKSLVEAGLAGPRLLQRAPKGGATRIALSPTTRVVFE